MQASQIESLISLHNDEIHHRNQQYGLVAINKCHTFLNGNCCLQLDKKELWEYISPNEDNTSKSDVSSVVDVELSNKNIPWSRFI